MSRRNDGVRRETLTVGHGYDPASAGGAAKPPAYLTSTFVYPSAQAAKDLHVAFFDGVDNGAGGHIYGRLGHPNLDMVEARLAALDGGEAAAAFASGMAAITAVLFTQLSPGDVLLHGRTIYGGTDAFVHQELPRFGIRSVAFADGTDRQSVAEAAATAMAAGPVGLVWAETPANPTAAVADIALLSEIADAIGKRQGRRPLLGIDNTFLGPFVQSPLAEGADLCMTSLTKYAGGHSDLLAGGVSGPADVIARLKMFRTLVGSTLDAHSAWLLLRSFETMHLRTERAAANAAVISAFLRDHPKVANVTYLGFLPEGTPARAAFERQCSGAGSTFSFRIRGGEAEAFRMLDALRVLRMAVSLGGTETLICHPASTTHYAVPPERRAASGIDDATLRVSVGIEHADDLIGDLAAALEAV
jgi:cystathionine gamma-synthase/methionine-gamma-lyase